MKNISWVNPGDCPASRIEDCTRKASRRIQGKHAKTEVTLTIFGFLSAKRASRL